MNDTIKPPTILLTAAQATVRWLAAQRVVVDGAQVPYFAGAWAIFGHGNVAGLCEALHAAGDALPTWRSHCAPEIATTDSRYPATTRPPRERLRHRVRSRAAPSIVYETDSAAQRPRGSPNVDVAGAADT